MFLFTKHQNMLNFLKIVLNFSGILKAVFGIAVIIVPDNISNRGCEILGYIVNLSAASFRISLTSFLLWRLKQIDMKKSDQYFGSFLMIMTTGFQVGIKCIFDEKSIY